MTDDEIAALKKDLAEARSLMQTKAIRVGELRDYIIRIKGEAIARNLHWITSQCIKALDVTNR